MANTSSRTLASSCRETFERDRKHLLDNPEDAKTWDSFRICTTELKRWNEAAAVSRAAIQKGTQQPAPHLMLGITDLHMKEYKKAADEFDEAIRLKHDQPLAYYYLGMAHLFLRQPEQAAIAGERAVELEPTNANNHSQLAYTYLLLDEREKCEQAAKEAVRLDPNNVAAYKVLGNLYAKEGRKEESDKAFEESIHANGRVSGVTIPVATMGGMTPAPASARPSGIRPVSNAPPPPDEADSSKEAPAGDLCSQQWSRMKSAMVRGDSVGALVYFSDYLDTRDQYRRSFEQMGVRAREVFASLGELHDCKTVLGSVTCQATITRPHGKTTETTVRCERNADKVWRIRSF